MKRKRSVSAPKVLSIFAGYPTSFIQAVCGVSKVTACLWKKGQRTPSRRAVRLFRLHTQGQVMPRTWEGWRFNERSGELVSPDGWTFQPGRLIALEILCRNGEFRRASPLLWESVTANLLEPPPPGCAGSKGRPAASARRRVEKARPAGWAAQPVARGRAASGKRNG